MNIFDTLKTHKTLVGISLGFGLILGILTSVIVIKYSHLSFSDKIAIQLNPFELISVIITVFLAVYVTRKLTKKNETERVERDILIQNIRNYQSTLIDKVKRYTNQQKCPELTEITTNFKILRQKMEVISELSSRIITEEKINQNNYPGKLKDIVRDILDIFTNAKIEQNEIQLQKQDITQISQKINQFEKISFDLIVLINRN